MLRELDAGIGVGEKGLQHRAERLRLVGFHGLFQAFLEISVCLRLSSLHGVGKHVLLIGRQAVDHVREADEDRLVEQVFPDGNGRYARSPPDHLRLLPPPAVDVVHLVQFPDHFDGPVGREELVAVLVIEAIGLEPGRVHPEKQVENIVSIARVQRAREAEGKPRAAQKSAHGPAL